MSDKLKELLMNTPKEELLAQIKELDSRKINSPLVCDFLPIVKKIKIAAATDVEIKILFGSDSINHSIFLLLKERKRVAEEYFVANADEKETMIEVFTDVNENLKEILGL